MIDFLKENYALLVEIGLSVCVILITLFKKKVKINSTFELLLTVLPGYIREAELKGSEGAVKYSYFLNRCIEYLVLYTGWSKERVIQEYATKIDVAIENILSTPQKKVR